MKNSIYILLILAFISCNKDDNVSDNENNEPVGITITSFEPKKLFYKDTLTILGENFNPNLNNTMTIDGLEQEIIYFTDKEIQVKVVDGTTSGNLQLINSETSVSIGDVAVSHEQIYRRIQKNNSFEIIKVNNRTGTEEAPYFNPICYNGYYMSNVVFSPSTDAFIAFSYFDFKGEEYDLFQEYYPTTGECSETNKNNSYGKLVVTNTGRLFGLTDTGIHELNPQNGNEINLVFSQSGLSDLFYDPSQNELIARYANDPTYFLYRYNIDTGETIPVKTQRFSHVVTLPSGKLFATGPTGPYGCSGLMELDRNSGEVLDVLFSVPSQYCPNNSDRRLKRMQYLPSVNAMIIEFSFLFGDAQYLPKQILYDFDTNEYSIYDLPNFYHYEYLNPNN
ncbi:MAG TPA: hypothetical protein DEA82_03710 [Flavobacteriaceae bacterium]|nr:hypothetical protein [Flavobacteriaceae bacterium]HBR53325.1 hypothetical protein [Flavobacteriaceae bacterium]